MTDADFDSLARGTESRQPRRIALKAFGATALAAAIGAPMIAEAKKNGKNKKRKKRNKNRNELVCPECPAEDCTQEAEQAAEARCLSQVATCEQEIRDLCDRNNDPEAEDDCLDDFLPCCQSLGVCDVPAFFACIAPESEV